MKDSKVQNARSKCPIACSLDVIGDKWTLLIIRDMLYRGRRRYNAFLKAPEDIRTNTLAERLRRLESNGIILKKEYQDNPIRYEYYLTDKGKELQPIVDQIAEWGLKHFPGTTLNKKA